MTTAAVADGSDAGFHDSLALTTVRRLQIFVPLIALVHVGHVLAYHVSDAERGALDATVVRWREGITAIHLGTLAALVPLALLAFTSSPGGRRARLVGPLFAAAYLVHGGLCTGIDQLVVKNVTAFTGYAFGIAVVLVLTPRQVLVSYAVGALALTAGVLAMQPDENARTSALLNAGSVWVVSMALAGILHNSRKREHAQRVLIELQRQELSSLNAALEERVQAQVAEIVRRATEVDALNAQLRTRVKDRSAELSLALERLARRRDSDGSIAPGSVLGGRFTVGELLGAGGMGAVYAGVDTTTGAAVAIKVIQASSARQLDALHRFLDEARSAATVSHPAVVRALHVDIDADGLLFQVQERVIGEDLEARLRRGSLSPAEAARLGAVLCDALAAAHAVGVVHRDVKPANIMVTADPPGLKLLDFGIAKLDDRGRPTEGTTSDADAGPAFVMGTPPYMSPEQRAGGDVDGRCDVYAVGVVLTRAVTGAVPSTDEARTERLRASPTPALVAGSADELGALAPLIARCLERDPHRRPTAAALADALRALA